MTAHHGTTEWLKLTALKGLHSNSSGLWREDTGLADGRRIDLDADFAQGGVWAGVSQFVELAYLELRKLGRDDVIEQHDYELYMALPEHRHEVQPRHFCLTDIAPPAEKTRRYPADRAYRIVHGLVGLVLRWKEISLDAGRWLVVVRNFDRSQHLGRRLFVELARRAAVGNRADIDLLVEMSSDFPLSEIDIAGVQAIRIAAELAGAASYEDQTKNIIFSSDDALSPAGVDGLRDNLEKNFTTLLAHYRAKGDLLAAAQVAFEMLPIYVGYGYYHEAQYLIDTFLPHFDQLVETDQRARTNAISLIISCFGNTGLSSRTSQIVEEMGLPYLTKPRMQARMFYILAMYHLRYAEVKNLELAERYIEQALDRVLAVKGDQESSEFPFLKVFTDNGLAFLRVRQGRHAEAIELCESGHRYLTEEMGEDHHKLHRSVLRYNVAQVYVMLDNLEEALKYYGMAIEGDPHYTEYYNDRGNLLQRMERYSEAVECYNLAIACSPPYWEVYHNKGLCHARLSESDEALASLELSLELNPDNAEGNALLGEVLEGLGRNDDALARYDAAIAIKTDFIAARVNRAILHFGDGRYDSALLDMDRVIEKEPGQESHFENRAEIYRAMGREDLYLSDLASAGRLRLAAAA